MKYIKKPVTIDAIQFNGSPDQVIEWLHTLPLEKSVEETLKWFRFNPEAGLCEIVTLEGTMQAHMEREITLPSYLEWAQEDTVRERRAGDFIIYGVKKEFYPCRADIFMDSYEPKSQEKELEANLDPGQSDPTEYEESDGGSPEGSGESDITSGSLPGGGEWPPVLRSSDEA